MTDDSLRSQLVDVSISPLITNKPATWKPTYASGWQGRQLTLEDLVGYISHGTAFIPAAMSSEHRSSAAFVHADIAVVDIDQGLSIEQFQAHPLAEYAAFIYTTPSHRDEPGGERFRVVFRLPGRISDPVLYKSVVTLLIKALGGDKSCTDPCRLFYGNSNATVIQLHPNTSLPEEFIDEARRQGAKERARFNSATDTYDESTIQQAIYVLEVVLDPTSDGQRDLFVRITAACASGGEAIYPAWSDWASRGHHGKGKNSRQTSERFFRGFSGKSTLGTLFFLASEQDPSWRKGLPEELRQAGNAASTTHSAVGYAHEDFLGSEDDLYDIDSFDASGQQVAQPKIASLFDYAAKQAQESSQAQRVPPDADSTNEPEPPEGFVDDPDLDPAPEVDPSQVKRGPGRPKKVEGDEISAIRQRLLSIYPGLRLNQMTLDLEYGSKEEPKAIIAPQNAYIYISYGTNKVYPKHIVSDTASVIAWENRYNPVTSYLDGCAANETPIEYFSEIASTLLGAGEESAGNPRLKSGQLYADAVIERFLIGAVARAFKPGCTHDWMPILVGSQNLGKSCFFQYLTPPVPGATSYPWTSTIQQGMSYIKDRPHVLHAGWIVVLDEVDRYFQRRYTEEFKNLVSVSVDLSSRKYENERKFQRAFVLAGATNCDDFIVDPTGNRRFMPIRVSGVVPSPTDPAIKIIDLDRLQVDRDRIWAAAYKAHTEGKSHAFDSAELESLAECSQSYTEDTAMTGALAQVLERAPTFIFHGKPCYTMVHLFESLQLELRSIPTMQRYVSDELKRMGYINKVQRVNGKPTRFWVKDASAHKPIKPWD